ncbi:hypothetical protein [Rossellomorea sp. BNER]|uniref:hypothetical protein n=1 Tax=Rossellomorea sp. BNER TaxID=2962031 RepID=UPI003AF22172|nr:hypothetical protein [Rossellomorea sp. BNER]
MKVIVKNIPVRYNGDRYEKGKSLEIEKKHFDDKLFSRSEEDDQDLDYFDLSTEKLKKVSNDDLKAFLEKESIDYPSNAVKEELIKLIRGEE